MYYSNIGPQFVMNNASVVTTNSGSGSPDCTSFNPYPGTPNYKVLYISTTGATCTNNISYSDPYGNSISFTHTTTNSIAQAFTVTYTPVPAPTISSIVANSGPPSGGTSITINGSYLLYPTVTIGGSAATVTASTANSITVTTPAHAEGAVNVVVTVPNGSVTSTGGFTYTKQSQAALTASASPSTIAFGAGNVAMSATGGSGTGALSYAVVSGPCSVSGSTLSTTGVGTCSVTASKAADSNYNEITSAPISVVVTTATQAALTTSASPANIAFNGTSALSTSGGSGTGAVSYAVTAGGSFCSISGSTLTGTGIGACTVTATKAADTNYNAATATVNVTVGQAAQAPLSASASPASIAFSGTSALSTGGGSGTGAVSYAVTAGGSFCSISGSTLTGTGVGACTVTATKAADTNYNAATATVNVSVGQAAQAPLSASASPTSIILNGTSALSTSGGSGTGAVSYAVTAGGSSCSISGSTLTGTGVGACTVTATKAADTNYSSNSADVSVTVTQGAQSITFDQPAAQPFTSGGQVPLSASASSGLTVAFASNTTDVCSVSGATATVLSAGSCSITASQAGNAAYLPASPVSRAFVISQGATTTSVSFSPTAPFVGQLVTFTTVVSSPAGTPTGFVTVFDGSTSLCTATLSGGTGSCTASFSTGGSHRISAIYSGSANLAASTSAEVVSAVTDQATKTASTVGKFMGQRLNQIMSYGPDASRQIDRLAAAGGEDAQGGNNAGFAPGGNGSFGGLLGDARRMGAGPDASDVSRMRGGVRAPASSMGMSGLGSAADATNADAHPHFAWPPVRDFDTLGHPDQSRHAALRFGGPFQMTSSFDGGLRTSFGFSMAGFTRYVEEQRAKSNEGLAFGAGLGSVMRSPPNPFDIWVEGRFTEYRDSSRGQDIGGHFGLVSIGADYVVNSRLLIGTMVQFDSMRQTSKAARSDVGGNGWMIGPYATLRLSQYVYLQGRAAWGKSSNEVSPFMTYTDKFDSTRGLVSGALVGRWTHGAWTFMPSATVSYMRDTAEGFVDTFGAAIPSVKSELGQAKAGPEISYRLPWSSSVMLEPRIGAQVIWGFAGGTTADGITIDGETAAITGVRGRAEIGIGAVTSSGLRLDLSGAYDGIGSGYSALSGTASLRIPLN